MRFMMAVKPAGSGAAVTEEKNGARRRLWPDFAPDCKSPIVSETDCLDVFRPITDSTVMHLIFTTAGTGKYYRTQESPNRHNLRNKFPIFLVGVKKKCPESKEWMRTLLRRNSSKIFYFGIFLKKWAARVIFIVQENCWARGGIGRRASLRS